MNDFNMFDDFINKYWFKNNQDENLIELFDSALRLLPPEKLRLIIQKFMYFNDNFLSEQQMVDVLNSIDKSKYCIYNGITINFDILSRFLFTLAIAEHKLSDIAVYPSEMRKERMDQIISKIGFNSEIVYKFFEKFSRDN